MRPLGINTYGYIWSTPMPECVRSLHALGYGEFELVVNPPHLDLDPGDASTRAARRELGATFKDEGIVLRSLNLPSLDTNLASSLKRMRAYSVQVFHDAIDLACDLGIRQLVTVPGRMSPLLPPAVEQRHEWLRESLNALLPHARDRGVVLALENVPFAALPDAESLGAFVRGFGPPGGSGLAVCYDAANAHFIGESPAQGLRLLRDLVSLVHLSDTTRSAWRHDAVGLGDVPFAEVAAALDEIGFAGGCMLEITDASPTAAIVRSHQALARLGFSPAPVDTSGVFA